MSTEPEAWVRRVKMQHLRAVLAVADSTSLAQAGERLGLTQPAVTKILHEVESSLGLQLFTRSSRGTVCTEAGRLMAERVRLMFSQLDQTVQTLRDETEGLSGRVTVGALIAGAASLLPLAVAQLQAQRPGIRLTIIEGTYDYLIPLLRQGVLDLIVGRLPKFEYREGLAVEALYQGEVALVVRPGHPVLGRGPLSLATLQAWPWIMPLPDTTLRQIIEATFHDLLLDMPVIRCESVSVVANRAMILQTDCICAFPKEVVQFELDRGLLAQLDIGQVLDFGPVGMSYRKGASQTPAAQALLAALRESTAP